MTETKRAYDGTRDACLSCARSCLCSSRDAPGTLEALFLSLKNVIKNEVRSGEKYLSAKKVFVLSAILGDGRKIEQKHPEELQIILCNMFLSV